MRGSGCGVTEVPLAVKNLRAAEKSHLDLESAAGLFSEVADEFRGDLCVHSDFERADNCRRGVGAGVGKVHRKEFALRLGGVWRDSREQSFFPSQADQSQQRKTTRSCLDIRY